jgi:hypothetical protein
MLYRFVLTYNGVETTVIQPKGWVDFESEIKRDFKSHGVMFKFTSGTLKLGFADGRDVLESAFQLEGLDAQVQLTADRRADQYASWENLFTGNAVMKNRELTESYFNVDFEGSSFQQKVINRLKNDIRLDATTDIDGNALTGSSTVYSGLWQGLRVAEEYEANYRTGGDSSLFETFALRNPTVGTTTDTTIYQHLTPFFTGVIEDGLKEYQVSTEAFVNGQASTSGYNLESAISGNLTISGSIKYQLQGDAVTDFGTGAIIGWVRWYVRHLAQDFSLISQDEITELQWTDLRTVSGSPFTWSFDTGVIEESFSFEVPNDISATDKIFVYPEIQFDLPAGNNYLDVTDFDLYQNSNYKLRLIKNAATYSVQQIWLVHDILTRMIEIITGETDRLYSDFFGNTENGYVSDGCGALMGIVNGSHLRLLDTPVSTSLSKFLESLNAIFGIGYSFQKEYDGSYKLRVEPLEYFYGDGEILDLGSPVSIKEKLSYKESIFDGLTFNNISIGYEKFSEDEDLSGSQDDKTHISKCPNSLQVEDLYKRHLRQDLIVVSVGNMTITYL